MDMREGKCDGHGRYNLMLWKTCDLGSNGWQAGLIVRICFLIPQVMQFGILVRSRARQGRWLRYMINVRFYMRASVLYIKQMLR